MWNFNRGVDWASDSTGNTALFNHCFVDGLEGDDSNDGANRTTPVKTLDRAIQLFPSTSVVKVVAPWNYPNQYGSTTAFNNHIILGDSRDDDVIFEDTLGTLNGANNQFNENIVLKGYLQANSSVRMTNCTFVDCNLVNIKQLRGCRIINSSGVMNTSGSASTASCAFINSPVTCNHANPATQHFFIGCYIDGNSTLNNSTPNTLFVQSCHLQNKSTWDISSVSYATTNTDGNPFINDSGILNYSIDPVNSPLFGKGFPDGFSNPRHMANYYVGQGFYSGLAAFDSAIALNPNLAIQNNELVNIGPNNVEFLETPVITLDSFQALGVPHKVGLLNYASTLYGLNATSGSLERVLEIKHAPNDNAALGQYKKYRFGERVTENSNGNGNGDDSYRWDQNNTVFAKKFQARIGVVKSGIVV